MLDTEGIHEHLVFMNGWDMMEGGWRVAEFAKHLDDTPHAKMESFGRELPIVVSLALFAMLIISCHKTLLSLPIQVGSRLHN